MIFGFNTDVQGKDGVYHVQTEDRGQRNPVVESIIYVGGKILGKKRTPYDPATSSKEQVEEAVRHQHKELMEAIRNGTWSAAPVVPPSSGNQGPERESQVGAGGGSYSVELTNANGFHQGEYFRFQLAVRNGFDHAPASEVGLEIRWILDGEVSDQQSLSSRSDGRAEVWVASPEVSQTAALVIRAHGAQGSAISKFVVAPAV